VRPKRRPLAIPAIVVVLAWLVVLTAWVFVSTSRGTGGSSEAGPAIARGRPPRAASPLDDTSAEIRINEQGVVTAVTADEPFRVLAAFCRSDATGSKQPVRVTATGDERRGIYWQGSVLWSIEIRKDPHSDLWTAGDGESPISSTTFNPAGEKSAKVRR
jgi:hypothetical protein